MLLVWLVRQDQLRGVGYDHDWFRPVREHVTRTGLSAEDAAALRRGVDRWMDEVRRLVQEEVLRHLTELLPLALGVPTMRLGVARLMLECVRPVDAEPLPPAPASASPQMVRFTLPGKDPLDPPVHRYLVRLDSILDLARTTIREKGFDATTWLREDETGAVLRSRSCVGWGRRRSSVPARNETHTPPHPTPPAVGLEQFVRTGSWSNTGSFAWLIKLAERIETHSSQAERDVQLAKNFAKTAGAAESVAGTSEKLEVAAFGVGRDRLRAPTAEGHWAQSYVRRVTKHASIEEARGRRADFDALGEVHPSVGGGKRKADQVAAAQAVSSTQRKRRKTDADVQQQIGECGRRYYCIPRTHSSPLSLSLHSH